LDVRGFLKVAAGVAAFVACLVAAWIFVLVPPFSWVLATVLGLAGVLVALLSVLLGLQLIHVASGWLRAALERLWRAGKSWRWRHSKQYKHLKSVHGPEWQPWRSPRLRSELAARMLDHCRHWLPPSSKSYDLMVEGAKEIERLQGLVDRKHAGRADREGDEVAE
jgi:hypothetical protein